VRNIRLIIEYDGTNYNGWQKQNITAGSQRCLQGRRIRTVQEVFESALEKILQEKIRLISSGRTDSGVHALGQVVNFQTHSGISPMNLQRALNVLLPADIAVKSTKEVNPDFHSRYDARSKIYRYLILNRRTRCAIGSNYVHFVPYRLNTKLMKNEARVLTGKHDFKSFQAADKRLRNSVRTIKRIRISSSGRDIVRIEIEADGFLYNMVRNIVGTLIVIGRGRLKKGAMKAILEAKDRKLAGPTAPAKGLCLVRVKY
jgi:tRNA pseudouridine38-40 synthase